MKIFVTGGLGFIGSNFIRHVLSAYTDIRLVNFDKQTYAGNPENLKDISSDKRYTLVKADITDREKTARHMEGTDVVVHFAAETHVDRSIIFPDEFIKTNVLGTQVLLDTAKKLNIPRFVHVSTDEVYGSKEKGYSKESDNLLPNSPYSASKAASDLLARSYYVTYKMPVMVTRCTNNFGPYQYPEKMLPLLITNAFNDQSFPVYGDGLQVRDWIYVLDHVKAVCAVMFKGKPGEIYNIGGMNGITNKELAHKVLRLIGKPLSLLKRVEDRPGHDRRYALDCSKIKKELGWKPEHNFNDALAETIEWYRKNTAWWHKLKDKTKYKSYYAKQYKKRMQKV